MLYPRTEAAKARVVRCSDGDAELLLPIIEHLHERSFIRRCITMIVRRMHTFSRISPVVRPVSH